MCRCQTRYKRWPAPPQSQCLSDFFKNNSEMYERFLMAFSEAEKYFVLKFVANVNFGAEPSGEAEPVKREGGPNFGKVRRLKQWNFQEMLITGELSDDSILVILWNPEGLWSSNDHKPRGFDHKATTLCNLVLHDVNLNSHSKRKWM